MRSVWRPLLCLSLLAATLPPALAFQPEQPPSDRARFVFYRTDNPLLFEFEPEIVVNGRTLGPAVAGEVFYRDARPGRYEVLLTNDPAGKIALQAEGGGLYFFRVGFVVDEDGPRLVLQAVDPAYARDDLVGYDTPAPP